MDVATNSRPRSSTALQELRAQQAREARRKRLLIGGGVLAAVLLVGGGVTAAVVSNDSSSSSASKEKSTGEVIPAAVTGSTTTQASAQTAKNPTNISGVLAWKTTGWPGGDESAAAVPGALEHNHVTGPVKYGITPPVGGPHNGTWMNAGVYTKPVPTERAVHNLEHGAVWITYRPNLPKTQVDQLVALVGKQSLIDESAATQIAGQQSRYMDLTPWASNNLPSPIVISAWGYQLRVDSASDPRLQKFIDTFRRNSTYTPEYGAGVDGIPTQTGGIAAQYGATKPNPGGHAPAGT